MNKRLARRIDHKAAKARRKVAIHCYSGPNGSGKSAAMVLDGMAAVRAGLPILSTVRVLDFLDPRPCDAWSCDCDKTDPARHLAAYEGWIPFRCWQDLLDFQGPGEVWMDEVTGVANSNDWASMPSVIGDRLMQLRRSELVVRWTSPSFDNGNKKLRQVTQAVTVCRGMASKRVKGHAWGQNRFFMWLTFDARLMDEFSNEAKRLKAYIRQFVWKPVSFAAYDTFESVLRLDDTVWGGTCLRCGGKVAQPRCTCPHEPPAGDPVVVALPAVFEPPELRDPDPVCLQLMSELAVLSASRLPSAA